MTDTVADDLAAILKEMEDSEEGKAPPVEGVEENTEEKQEEQKPEDTKEEQKPEEGVKEEAPEEKPEDPLLVKDKAPSAWSPQAREKWSDLPKEIRDEIIRREDAGAKGVRQLQEKYQPLENAVGHLQPFLDEAKQMGLDGGAYIARTMAAERNLRNPDINIKFGQLLDIADQYGIPLRRMINDLAGQQVIPNPPPPQANPNYVPPHIQRELEERRQADQKRMEEEVASFAKDHEFFEDVKETMADLIDIGRAKTLEAAYNEAIKLDDRVQEILTARKSKEQEQQRKQTQASKTSPKGTGDALEETDTRKDEELSLEELVRRQMTAATSGRV